MPGSGPLPISRWKISPTSAPRPIRSSRAATMSSTTRIMPSWGSVIFDEPLPNWIDAGEPGGVNCTPRTPGAGPKAMSKRHPGRSGNAFARSTPATGSVVTSNFTGVVAAAVPLPLLGCALVLKTHLRWGLPCSHLRPIPRPSRPWFPGRGSRASPAIQERDEVVDAVAGPRRLDPRREPVDGDVARAQLAGERRRDRVRAGYGQDRASAAEPARRLPVDDRGAADGRVDDDVDVPERRGRLHEQALDVELVGHVGTNRERRAVGADDLIDHRVGLRLVAEVDHDDGVVAVGQLRRHLAADPARAAGDDRDVVAR